MEQNSQPQQRLEGGPAVLPRPWPFFGVKALPNPVVTYVGLAAVWWIPKPLGPRISLRAAAIAWFLGFLALAVTILFLEAHSKPLWPFGRQISSAPEILMRYELIFLVCLAYVTGLSATIWFRYRGLARADAAAINKAIQEERWELAALLLHRYCLLVSAIWRRVPSQVDAWDSILIRKLPHHRRFYVYYRDTPPSLPADATASFVPAIVPSAQPSLWSAAALIPVAFLLYTLVVDILERGHWQRAVLFNAVLLAAILVCYGTYFFTSLLGRSNYFRFSPGVMQLLRFMIRRRKPVIETFDLREIDVVLDLSSPSPGLILLNPPGYRRVTFRLPRGPEVIEALFRATLSTVPTPPLSEDQLVE